MVGKLPPIAAKAGEFVANTVAAIAGFRRHGNGTRFAEGREASRHPVSVAQITSRCHPSDVAGVGHPLHLIQWEVFAMFRQLQLLTVLVSMTITSHIALTEGPRHPDSDGNPPQGNADLRPNSLEANKSVAMTNKIVKPVPLSADSQRHALANIDRHIRGQIKALAEKLKAILPDELAILTKTTGWKTEDQQALVTALRAGDPTAVYETWVKGNSKDIAGAELAAHQTDVKRLMARLTLDVEKNKTAMKQDVAEFDMALGKIAGATPAVADVGPAVKTLKTWVEARKLIEIAPRPAKVRSPRCRPAMM